MTQETFYFSHDYGQTFKAYPHQTQEDGAKIDALLKESAVDTIVARVTERTEENFSGKAEHYIKLSQYYRTSDGRMTDFLLQVEGYSQWKYGKKMLDQHISIGGTNRDLSFSSRLINLQTIMLNILCNRNEQIPIVPERDFDQELMNAFLQEDK